MRIRTVIERATLAVAGIVIACSSPKASAPAAGGTALVSGPTIPAEMQVGKPAVISFVLRNDGPAAADGVILTIGNSFFEALPVTLIQPTPSSDATPLGLREIIWGAPNPGREVEYRLTVQPKASGARPFTGKLMVGKETLRNFSGTVNVAA